MEEQFQFRWREPGMEGRNAAQANLGYAQGSAYNPYISAAHTADAITYGDTMELDAEIEQIRRKIASLEIEREQLQKSMVNRDELDRRLAANRARVGDIGTSRAHQADIANRQQVADTRVFQERLRAMDEQKNARSAIDSYREKIDDLNAALAWGSENKAFAQDKVKYDRYVKELRERYGVDYDPFNSGNTPGSTGSSTGLPMTDEGWKIFKAQFTDKNGNWLSQEWKDFYEQNRPQNTIEGAEDVKKSKGTKTADEVEKARKARLERKKKAAGLVNKYASMSGADAAKFKNRWNAATPDEEIKVIKEFYDFDFGTNGFKAK